MCHSISSPIVCLYFLKVQHLEQVSGYEIRDIWEWYIIIVSFACISDIYQKQNRITHEKCGLDYRTEIQKTRLDLVDKTCNEWNLNQDQTIERKWLNSVLVDDDRQLLFCFIPKVACTNWKTTLSYTGRNYKALYPNGDHVDEYIHTPKLLKIYGLRFLDTYPKDQFMYRLQHYYKAMFVRNPLDRVVSAYRDKFEILSKHTKKFHEKYGKAIIKK